MDSLSIDISSETPRIILDKENNILEIAGNSIPEDAQAFYDPILEWIDDYLTSPNPKTNFVFKLEYFNTASSKSILELLKRLSSIHETKQSEVLINWRYEEDDEDILEAGEDYKTMVDVPFKMVEVEEAR